jgi:threonine synthase
MRRERTWWSAHDHSLSVPAPLRHGVHVKYISTRDPGHAVALSEAISLGLAPDGGLYVPHSFPQPDLDGLPGAGPIAGIGERLLGPFFEGDVLAPELAGICRSAFDFPIPLKPLRDRTSVLELFHGPTAAFKDVGARFLAECLSRLHAGADRPLTILVATSGDTGGAVAAAFHGRPGVEVVILYPRGRVSPRQEKQLTTWGDNVRPFAVRGDFDDCQRMAKRALTDPQFRTRWKLSSANSINLGRLLPQMVYYAAASLEYVEKNGVEPGFIIPSGNVGNATAGLWAQRLGLPIREVVLATNENPALSDYVDGGDWTPRPTRETLATAMDVGNPSNMERIFELCGGVEGARERLRAFRVTDDEIRAEIRGGLERWGEIWDPHTATAVAARGRVAGDDWILVATAHPAKFEGVVEPLVGRDVELPPSLARILERPSRSQEIEPELAALWEVMGG